MGPATGPSRVDRSKAGSKHHLIVEALGIPVTANHHRSRCAVVCSRQLRVGAQGSPAGRR